MHNHYFHNLNLAKWLLEAKPRCVVECGAGTGELTTHLVGLKNKLGFRLCVISDNDPGFGSDVEFIRGISYKELEKFPDNSIDFCIIDTDHNYWTLAKELEVLHKKLSDGAYVAIHDVATFYHDTGMALSYSDGSPYPKDAIESCAPSMGGLGNALMDFLHIFKFDYRLVEFTSESHGAAIIQKKVLLGISIMVPGDKPMYAGVNK